VVGVNGTVNATSNEQTLNMLHCISNSLEAHSARSNETVVSWLLILAGALVFFMQTAFAMLCAGCVRKKNVQK
jgi:Amt family ammonium transporter